MKDISKAAKNIRKAAEKEKLEAREDTNLAAGVRARILTLALNRLNLDHRLHDISVSSLVRGMSKKEQAGLATGCAEIISTDSGELAQSIADVCSENTLIVEKFLPFLNEDEHEFHTTVTLWAWMQASLVHYNALVCIKQIMSPRNFNRFSAEEVVELREWLNATKPIYVMDHNEAAEA